MRNNKSYVYDYHSPADLYKKGVDFIFNRYSLYSIKEKIKAKLLNMATDKVKTHFGEEILLESWYAANRNIDLQYLTVSVVDKFIRHYDSNFNDHFSLYKKNLYDTDYISYTLKNGWTIIPIKEHPSEKMPSTFMYVACGDTIYNFTNEYKTVVTKATQSDLYIYICGKKSRSIMKSLNKFIDSLSKKRQEENTIQVYTATSNNLGYKRNDDTTVRESLKIVYNTVKSRDLSTLYYSNGEIETICNHIDRFISQKDFYSNRNILYKTGILLYGNPGTGKSSLVNALANRYDRDIINVVVNSIKNMDLIELTNGINADTLENYIVLFEDIDTLFLNRENDVIDKDDNATINKLLQFLDSNSSPTNVIFIATTNYINRLDSALLRDGRFDLKLNIAEIKAPEAIKFCNDFGLSTAEAEQVLAEYATSINEESVHAYNQSKLQNIVLQHVKLNL